MRALLVFSVMVSGLFYSQDTTDYQLLWEIKAPKTGKVSYIFGSYHSNDPKLFNFPDSVYNAFYNAEIVALETDVSALFENYDVRLSDYSMSFIRKESIRTNSNEASLTTYGSEDGRPQFIDAYFQQTAHCAGKKFFALESFEDQTKVLEKISLSKLSIIPDFKVTKEDLTAAYLNGNISKLSNLLKSELKQIPGAYDLLITDRNIKMVEKLDSLCRNSQVFCVVGSAHLGNVEGMIQLLRSKGFFVRKVSSTYMKENCLAEKNAIKSWNKYTYRDEKYGFSVVFSGKPKLKTETSFTELRYAELGQGNNFIIRVEPSADLYNRIKNDFIKTLEQSPQKITLENGATGLEGLFYENGIGYVWKRILFYNGKSYELSCYGGNKFMHSNRPSTFFNRFIFVVEN